MDDELIYKKESYEIIGACIEVHNDKGAGFLEPVYQECLEWEFSMKGVPFAAQVPLGLSYKGNSLKNKYVPDFICYDTIIVEIKAVRALGSEHSAQLLNYLKATGLKLGILVNFNSYPKLEYRCQYGESDYAFISRLLEDAGITFFFEQDESADDLGYLFRHT